MAISADTKSSTPRADASLKRAVNFSFAMVVLFAVSICINITLGKNYGFDIALLVISIVACCHETYTRRTGMLTFSGVTLAVISAGNLLVLVG